MRFASYLPLVFLSLILLACGDDAQPPADAGSEANPLAELGRFIFFDTRLSRSGEQSCASCHDPSAGFADPDSQFPTSEGSTSGLFGSRNAPTSAYAFLAPPRTYVTIVDPADPEIIIYQGYQGGQFLDGRRMDLVAQAKDPFLNPIEMANIDQDAVVRQVSSSSYVADYLDLFGVDGFTNVAAAYDVIASALAEFEKSAEMNPFSSKFDFYQKGLVSLTAAELRGLELFKVKGKCSICHTLADPLPNPDASASLFTDFRYFNIGVPKNPNNPFYSQNTAFNPDGVDFIDLGLGGDLLDSAENGKFKTPTLRNIELTAPYMHNGVFDTLEQVVEFYNSDIFSGPPEVDSSNIDGNVGFLDLDINTGTTEIADLVAFLKTLTDGYVP